ncbi:MAG: DUF177 domain-containing protein [Chloroflexi bacterium]|nr:DUF177 domain-containing protein [Chloroflexota bacterium]
MRFHVAQLLAEPTGSSRSYSVRETVDEIAHEVPIVGAVEGQVVLIRTSKGILVSGRLTMTVELSCSRCLTECQTRLPCIFDEEYLATVDILTGTRLPPAADPSVFTIAENHILDITEAVRQCALTELPMKPLCREDCLGLCPSCGQNRNLTSCSCGKELDARWARLRDLLPPA